MSVLDAIFSSARNWRHADQAAPGAPAPLHRGRALTLVVVIGPPAVGKVTVGRALERHTGLPLLQNHMAGALVLPFFEVGSEPFSRLVSGIRQQLFEEIAASDLPGLIFTFVWKFDQVEDLRFIEETRALFERHGGRVAFVELYADLETRMQRNGAGDDDEESDGQPDATASVGRLLALEHRHRMSSDGEFPFPAEHLLIDVTDLEPAATARRIASHFALPLCR
jgi:hypothetical protein